MLLPGALLIGILIGVAFAAIGYGASRGKRDFNSITQTVAAKYEVLCEHKVANQAREMLGSAPGARAAQFDPRNQPAAWHTSQPPYPQPGGYPAQPQYGPPVSHTGYGPVPQPGYGPAPQSPAPTESGDSTPPHGSSPQSAESPRPTYGDQPYGSYGSAEGIGQVPDSEQDGRSPRGDN